METRFYWTALDFLGRPLACVQASGQDQARTRLQIAFDRSPMWRIGDCQMRLSTPDEIDAYHAVLRSERGRFGAKEIEVGWIWGAV